jgi:hypothetical protein
VVSFYTRIVTQTIADGQTNGQTMAARSSVTWTHYSVRYEVTWGKTLASARTRTCVREDASVSARTRTYVCTDTSVSVRTGSVHAMDAKGFGETT